MEKFKTALTAGVAAACILLMSFPLPHPSGARETFYACDWGDGVTEESYVSAMRDFCGIEEGAVLLERDGKRGRIAASSEFELAREALTQGDFAALYTVETEALGRIERAALYRTFQDTLWYSYGAFEFDGRAVVPTGRAYANRVVLYDGEFPSGYLAATGARFLRIGANAEISAEDLAGSSVTEWEAAPPYAASGGALFLDTPGGRRLLAGLPHAEELAIGDCAFADRGALTDCTRLTSLTLPFAGSEKGNSSGRVGEFRYLFTTENGSTVPETLTSVTVMGGRLDAYCFYGCGGIRRIDVCKVDPLAISPQAFSGAVGLLELHAPRADLLLEGDFSRETAPCGCTVYRRISEETR